MKICQEDKDGVLVVRVTGDIDINTSPDVKKTFDRTISGKPQKVIINLKEVNYVDSSGLATLVEILKNMRANGGKLKISNLSQKVKGLFEITRLDKLFDISGEEQEAMESF